MQGGAIISMIEQQLTRFITAMSARTDAVQRGAEAGHDELARHFQNQIDALRTDLNSQPEVPTQLGLDPQVRTELQAELRADLQLELHTALRDELHHALRDELRSALRDELRSELRAELTSELQAELRSEQLSEREKVGMRLNQFATQSSAVAKQLVDTAAALHQRINDTGRALEGQLDEHSIALTKTIAETVEASRAVAAEKLSIIGRKVDENDQRAVDRMLALEERLNDQNGTRFADLDANIGRVGRGVDEAIGAMSHRLSELDAAHLGLIERIEQLAVDVSKVDEEALNRLSEQMSSAVGESMLVRIEMDRLSASTNEHIDKVNVRIGELATIVNDATMDVSTAVQLERLEEIERALVELDPDQFVRKDELEGGQISQSRPAPAAQAPAPDAFDEPFHHIVDSAGSRGGSAAAQPAAQAPAVDPVPAAAVNGHDKGDLTPDDLQFLVASMDQMKTEAAEAAEAEADTEPSVEAWFDQPVPAPQFEPAPEPDPNALTATLEWEEHVESIISGPEQLVPLTPIDPANAHPRRRAADFGLAEERPAPHLLRRADDTGTVNADEDASSERRASENGPISAVEGPDDPDEVTPFLPSSPTKFASEAYSSDTTLSSW